MGLCIGFAGCQSEHHRPGCAKFDQKAADIHAISSILGQYYGESDWNDPYRREAWDAFSRLIGNDYKEQP